MGKAVQNSGYTLIELLVALSLLSIIFVICSKILAMSIKSYSRLEGLSQIQHDAMYAMQQVSMEVRSGILLSDCVDPCDRSTLKIRKPGQGEEYIIIQMGYSGGKKVLNRLVYRYNRHINTRKIIDNIEDIMFNYNTSDGILSIKLTTCKPDTDVKFTTFTNFYCRIEQ